jgi:hypothetical protein
MQRVLQTPTLSLLNLQQQVRSVEHDTFRPCSSRLIPRNGKVVILYCSLSLTFCTFNVADCLGIWTPTG